MQCNADYVKQIAHNENVIKF